MSRTLPQLSGNLCRGRVVRRAPRELSRRTIGGRQSRVKKAARWNGGGVAAYSAQLTALRSIGISVSILDNEPQLSARATFALVAWRDLCGDRQIGMSVGPIPWRAIAAWCDWYEIERDDAADLIELVQTYDATWLHDSNTESGPRSKHSADSQGSNGSRVATSGFGGHVKH